MSATEWIGASQVIRSRCGVQHLVGGGHRQVRVLEPRVREGLRDQPVELGIGLHVDRGAPVVALEVDRVDSSRIDQAGDELLVPGVGRVELELEVGVSGRHPLEPVEHRRVAKAHRDDEVERGGLAPQHLVERASVLAQGKVQRRRLESPAAVETGEVAHRRVREEVKAFQVLRKGVDRPVAGKRQHRPGGPERNVVEAVVDHVLPDAILASTTQLDQRSHARLGAPGLRLPPVECIGLDGERQVGNQVIGGHRPGGYPPALTGLD